MTLGHAAGLSNAPLYIALDRGYFQDEGLTVDLKAFKSGGDMVAPLSSGQLDAGTGAPGAGLFNAIGRGLGIRLVADTGQLRDGTKYSCLLVDKKLVDSGRYKSIADLKGERLGLYADGTSTTLWFDKALASAGLERSDVQANYLSGPDQAIGLENGSIDATNVAEPYATKLVDEGTAVRVACGGDFYPGQQLGAIMYGTDFSEKNPDGAVSFMKAYLRGVADFRASVSDGHIQGADSDEIVQIVAKYTELDPELIAKTFVAPVDPNGALNAEGLADDIETYRKAGLIENSGLTVDDVVDTSFVEKAAAAMPSK
ncbi:ABC transporter substrate-binding protein [Gordonia humi]|uniref:NitT/TauT family transport system substrate-binding protein n=1 Tax=Gordonia humi TaxID=686429 RepID=A0A840EX97_9ACTN|nr:NitT/TauT family transport system substrate-binding protein [Gordonia humi]